MSLPDWARHQPWVSAAACHGAWDIMFAVDPKPAKAICAGCTVRQECLVQALTRREPTGVWGGFDTAEREALQKATPKEIPRLLRQFATQTSSRRTA